MWSLAKLANGWPVFSMGKLNVRQQAKIQRRNISCVGLTPDGINRFGWLSGVVQGLIHN